MAEFKLKAGTGRAEIRFRQADLPLKAFTGIHDRIHARVLILEAGIRMALVSVELTSLPEEAIQRFQQECSRETGICEEHIFVSVTHTFSAPHIPPHVKNEQEQRLSDIMYDRICEAVCEAASEAKESVRETDVAYGEASCCLNVNRNKETSEGYWIGRNEDGFSDHRVRVLTFRQGSKRVAYLMNYDIQPSVMDKSESVSGGRLISGDLAGAALRELEKEEGVTAFFVPGCAGDQAPVVQAVRAGEDGTETDLHEDGFVLAEELGKYLAEQVRRVESASGREGSEEHERGQRLELLSCTAVLPEQEMKYPTKELRPHRQYSFNLTGRSVQVPVVLLKLGAIGFLMTSPELNSGFGKKIRQILGEKLLIGTLVNGAVKYLPEAEDFERITYEAMNTKLGPGSAERFLDTVRELEKKCERARRSNQ